MLIFKGKKSLEEYLTSKNCNDNKILYLYFKKNVIIGRVKCESVWPYQEDITMFGYI